MQAIKGALERWANASLTPILHTLRSGITMGTQWKWDGGRPGKLVVHITNPEEALYATKELAEALREAREHMEAQEAADEAALTEAWSLIPADFH